MTINYMTQHKRTDKHAYSATHKHTHTHRDREACFKTLGKYVLVNTIVLYYITTNDVTTTT